MRKLVLIWLAAAAFYAGVSVFAVGPAKADPAQAGECVKYDSQGNCLVWA